MFGAAAVSDAADIDTIDDYGRACDNADQPFGVGWVSGDAAAIYPNGGNGQHG